VVGRVKIDREATLVLLSVVFAILAVADGLFAYHTLRYGIASNPLTWFFYLLILVLVNAGILMGLVYAFFTKNKLD